MKYIYSCANVFHTFIVWVKFVAKFVAEVTKHISVSATVIVAKAHLCNTVYFFPPLHYSEGKKQNSEM